MSQPLLGEPHEPEIVDENADLWAEIEELRGELKGLRAEYKRDLETIGRILQSGRVVFGGGNESPAQAAGPSQPLDAARYAPWKEKFPGQTAAAIDILVKYQAGLSRKQLAGFLKVEPGSGTMSQIIFKLNKADLIEKDGNVIRLRKI